MIVMGLARLSESEGARYVKGFDSLTRRACQWVRELVGGYGKISTLSFATNYSYQDAHIPDYKLLNCEASGKDGLKEKDTSS